MLPENTPLSPAEAPIPEANKKRRPSAADNEELIRAAKAYPKSTLKEIIQIANYPAGEETARKRLKEADVTLKPRKPKTKAKKGRKMWVLVPAPKQPHLECRWLQKLEKRRQKAAEKAAQAKNEL